MDRILVQANEATAKYRRVFFQLVDAADGITAELGEAGGQPQISVSDPPVWSSTGIGVLGALGNGRYYADLAQATVATAGDVIETRYKSAATAECPGDSVQVVSFNPRDLTGSTAAELASALAGTVPINLITPVTPVYLDIYRLDAYSNAQGTGRRLTISYRTGDPWPDTITDAKFYAKPTAQTLEQNASAASLNGIDCVVVTASGGSRAVRVEFTSVQTGTLEASVGFASGYEWWVVGNVGASQATLRSGTMTVRPPFVA